MNWGKSDRCCGSANVSSWFWVYSPYLPSRHSVTVQPLRAGASRNACSHLTAQAWTLQVRPYHEYQRGCWWGARAALGPVMQLVLPMRQQIRALSAVAKATVSTSAARHAPESQSKGGCSWAAHMRWMHDWPWP